MSFTPNLARAQFSALSQTFNDLPVTFLDGPGGSQVPQSVLEAMQAVRPPKNRDAHSTRDNHDMRGERPFFQNHTLEPPAIIFE